MIFGIALGALIGAFQGWLIAYRGIPSFIVTLGGLLVWRGAAFLSAAGETISPVDRTFALLGGGPFGVHRGHRQLDLGLPSPARRSCG